MRKNIINLLLAIFFSTLMLLWLARYNGTVIIEIADTRFKLSLIIALFLFSWTIAIIYYVITRIYGKFLSLFDKYFSHKIDAAQKITDTMVAIANNDQQIVKNNLKLLEQENNLFIIFHIF